MYVAKHDHGKYKKGDEVPEHEALDLIQRYAKPPVEEVAKASGKKASKPKEEESSSDLLDDYLNRNSNVVLKNLKKDSFSEGEVSQMYELEKNGKKRRKVLRALEGLGAS